MTSSWFRRGTVFSSIICGQGEYFIFHFYLINLRYTGSHSTKSYIQLIKLIRQHKSWLDHETMVLDVCLHTCRSMFLCSNSAHGCATCSRPSGSGMRDHQKAWPVIIVYALPQKKSVESIKIAISYQPNHGFHDYKMVPKNLLPPHSVDFWGFHWAGAVTFSLQFVKWRSPCFSCELWIKDMQSV